MSNFIAPETRDLESHQHPAGLARAQIECWVQDGIRWIFAYGSLIWDPVGPWTRRERARLVGYHRRVCIGSRAYRGTPELPGSLLGLMPGGSCVGIGYELAEDGLRQAMDVVVAREMPLGTVPIYLPRRAAVQLDTGERVIALVFVADRTSPHFEPLPDEAAAAKGLPIQRPAGHEFRLRAAHRRGASGRGHLRPPRVAGDGHGKAASQSDCGLSSTYISHDRLVWRYVPGSNDRCVLTRCPLWVGYCRPLTSAMRPLNLAASFLAVRLRARPALPDPQRPLTAKNSPVKTRHHAGQGERPDPVA